VLIDWHVHINDPKYMGPPWWQHPVPMTVDNALAAHALVGLDRVPGSDEMKHFGAALASYGSVALFHMVGITPEAQRLQDVIPAGDIRTHDVGANDIRAFQAAYAQHIEKVDLVVFSAPQLSLVEMRQLAGLLDGRRADIPLLAVTSPQVKPDADRMGLTARIEAAGGTVLAGMCFYQSYAREMAEANGWKRLATNSAKLTNIIGGYGYRPALMSMASPSANASIAAAWPRCGASPARMPRCQC